MKLYTFLLILLFLGCSSSQSLDNSEKLDEPVLEVVTEAIGMLYPREGDILQMRLSESGRFEYDDFLDYDHPRVTSRNVVIRRKEAKLSPEETRELIDLAEQPGFLSAKKEYPTFNPRSGDAFSITKIKFTYKGKEKQIVAHNFWDTQFNKELKLNYPQSMVKLLERVEELKAKAIGRKSTQWLVSPSNE